MPTHALASLSRVTEKFDLDGEVIAEEDAEAGAEQPTRVLEPYREPRLPGPAHRGADRGDRRRRRRPRRRRHRRRGARRRRRRLPRPLPAQVSRRKAGAPGQRPRQPLLPCRRPPARALSAGSARLPWSWRSSAALALPPARLRRRGRRDGGPRRRRLAPAAGRRAARSWSAPGSRAGAGSRVRAEAVDPGRGRRAAAGARAPAPRRRRPSSRTAVERMRFALGVDDDLGEFYRRFRRDPLLGPAIRRRPWLRPRRRPWPWEALAWAVVKQLIESGRAARIQRRIVGRWGARLGPRRGAAPRRALGGADRRPGAGRTGARRPLAQTLGRARRGRPADRRRPRRPRRAAAPTGACSRFPRSAPGPCSASASSAAANRIRCPPAT